MTGPCRPLHWNVDTLWVAYRGVRRTSTELLLQQAQSGSRELERRTAQACDTVDLCGQRFYVRPHPIDVWQYYLDHEDGLLDIACYPRVRTTKPTVRIRLGSPACWSLGRAGLLDLCAAVRHWLLEPTTPDPAPPPDPLAGMDPDALEAAHERLAITTEGYQFDRETLQALATAKARKRADEEPALTEYVQRLDLCVDFQGWIPRPADEDRFVGRFGQQTRNKKHPGGASPGERAHRMRRVFTGFEFGIAPHKQNLYRKDVEIDVSKKNWFRKLWANCPGYAPEEQVWRLEDQAWRNTLATFRTASGQPFQTVAETLAHIPAIWRYATEKWCRLVVDSKGEQLRHRNTAPEWAALQAIDWGQDAQTISREHQKQAELKTLLPQLVGAAVHAAALLKGRPRNWTELAAVLEEEVGKYLEAKDTSVGDMLVKWLTATEAGEAEPDLPF